MRKFFSLIAAVLFAGSMMATVYVKATSIAAGDVVVLASPDVLMELSGISNTSTKYGTGVAFTGAPAGVFTLTVEAGTAENSFAFKTSDNKYLTWTSGNSLNVADEKSDNTSWTVTIDSENGRAAIVNVATATRQIWWNVSSPRFAAYENKSHGDGYKCPSLYIEGEAPAVAEPVIGPIATLFYEQVEISIECETEGASIYYTLDGSAPTAEATHYTAPFTLNETATVKAIAILGEDASAVAEKTYTAGVARTVADALAALDDRTYIANQFVVGTICSVDFYNATYHSISYKLSDDGTDANALTVYSGKGLNGAEFESIEDLVVGSQVVVLGDLTVFNETKEFQQGSKIVKIISVPAAGCNWDNIEFLGNGSGVDAYTNRFKVCAGDPAPTSIVNIQAPGWAAEPGIYMSFPSAAWGEISLAEGQYAIDGAGMVLYASAFLYDAETEVTIVCQDVTYTLTIFNANPEEAPAQLVAVSDSTTWDFSKIAANTASSVYKKEGIQLTATSAPSINDEVIYAEYADSLMTLGAEFDGASMAFKGEYPVRKNKYCQNGELHFKAAVAGSIVVKFSDTGTTASDIAVPRYLVVNGEQTEYWTSRENNGTENPYPAQLNVETGAIAVPAGDVRITGSSAIVVYYVTFVPAKATAIDNTAAEAKAEKIMRNGMILIVKGDKTYNVMGQIVK